MGKFTFSFELVKNVTRSAIEVFLLIFDVLFLLAFFLLLAYLRQVGASSEEDKLLYGYQLLSFFSLGWACLITSRWIHLKFTFQKVLQDLQKTHETLRDS